MRLTVRRAAILPTAEARAVMQIEGAFALLFRVLVIMREISWMAIV